MIFIILFNKKIMKKKNKILNQKTLTNKLIKVTKCKYNVKKLMKNNIKKT